jgi:hypothetical protein
MARTYTVAQLITRARALADVNGTDTFITDVEVQLFLDQAYSELVDILARASIHHFETSSNITTDGTNDSYALPADHYKTLAVDYRYATDCYAKVEPLMFEERNNYMLGINGSARGFRVVGSSITLYPKPPANQVYRHIYVPIPAKIATVATSTDVDGIAGWEEYIVVHVARTIRQKQEDDAAVMHLTSKLSDMHMRIDEMAQDREPPRRIVDVTDQGWDWDPVTRWWGGW